MGILDRLSKDRASFIGLHDMLTAVAAANQCSYSDAARGINSIICKINLDDLPIAYIYCFDSTFRQEVRLGGDECFMQCNDLLMVFNFATRAENISFVDGVERIYIRDVEPGKLHKRLFTYGFEPRAIQEFLKKFDVEMNVENYQGRSAAPKELPLPWVAPTQSAVRSPFITVRQGVELISQGNGVSTGDAARQLIDLLNAAAHGGRPGLFERDGAALKKVDVPDERYVKVIQSLDALRRGPPIDDRNDPYANLLRSTRRSTGGFWRTAFDLYPGEIAVLDLVEVRAAEFERFALLAPCTSSGNEVPLIPTATTPLIIEGTVVKKNRSDPLIACIALAKKEAADPNDWSSVWVALVKLARSTDRPTPLLGYTEGEGIKFDAPDHPDEVRHLTRNALRMRFNRKNKNGAARQRTPAHGSVT